MSTHPLWRPFELTDLAQSDAAVVGSFRSGKVRVVPYDASWPERAAELIESIRDALGHRVLGLEHVGSTSVLGLAAKPDRFADDVRIRGESRRPQVMADHRDQRRAAPFVVFHKGPAERRRDLRDAKRRGADLGAAHRLGVAVFGDEVAINVSIGGELLDRSQRAAPGDEIGGLPLIRFLVIFFFF